MDAKRERKRNLTSNRDRGAIRERIACVSRVTRTHRYVINRFATGLQSTGSWTGISALETYTGHRLGAIGVLGTFGSASFVWVTNVVWQTGTGADAIVLATDRVDTTRGWLAWFPNV